MALLVSVASVLILAVVVSANLSKPKSPPVSAVAQNLAPTLNKYPLSNYRLQLSDAGNKIDLICSAPLTKINESLYIEQYDVSFRSKNCRQRVDIVIWEEKVIIKTVATTTTQKPTTEHLVHTNKKAEFEPNKLHEIGENGFFDGN